MAENVSYLGDSTPLRICSPASIFKPTGRRNESSTSMASSSGNEKNQNMVNSANKADDDETIIPRKYTIDGVQEYLRTQRMWCDPPYPDGDPNLMDEEYSSGKKSRPRAKDTKWGWLTHEYVLEQARIYEQEEDQMLEERLPQKLMEGMKLKEGLPEK